MKYILRYRKSKYIYPSKMCCHGRHRTLYTFHKLHSNDSNQWYWYWYHHSQLVFSDPIHSLSYALSPELLALAPLHTPSPPRILIGLQLPLNKQKPQMRNQVQSSTYYYYYTSFVCNNFWAKSDHEHSLWDKPRKVQQTSQLSSKDNLLNIFLEMRQAL